MHVLTSHFLIYEAERTHSACCRIHRSREPTVRCDVRKRDVLCPSATTRDAVRVSGAAVWCLMARCWLRWPELWVRSTSVTRTSFEIYKSIQNMIVIMTNIFLTLIRWNNGRLFICFLNACYRSYCEQFVITYIWFIYSFDLYWNVSFIEILL